MTLSGAHNLFTALLGLVALVWLVIALRIALGVRRIPHLAAVQPLPDDTLPRVSVLFSARDEAEKMPAALRSILAQEFPSYEVIAVDDRSADATGEILLEMATTCNHLKPVHVRELPPGWLGKPHGLYTAYRHSTGEWLVFTDADVQFAPGVLRRAVSLALERGWDHLTLVPEMEMVGFWEKVLLTFFGFGFFIYTRLWNVQDRRSRAYAGVGAFQLVRRSVYEAIGTHRRLALEVIDDMKLAYLVKEAGFASGAAIAHGFLRLRWHAGLGNIMRGTEKNFFAAAGFRLPIMTAQVASLLLLSVLPFLALPFARGWALACAAVAAAAAVMVHGSSAGVGRVSPLYGLTHPLGAVLFAFMLTRSTILTIRQRGIRWRGTFYPLEDLRRGVV